MDEIITPAQVAELLKMHVKTVYKLAREGVIAGNRIGHSWRFSKNHILDLLVRQDGKAPASPVSGPVSRHRSV